MAKKVPNPAMPDDDRKGEPDGVNTQAGESGDETRKTKAAHSGSMPPGHSDLESFFGHGGQSKIGYHGPQQLGDEEVEKGGNPNAGAKRD